MYSARSDGAIEGVFRRVGLVTRGCRTCALGASPLVSRASFVSVGGFISLNFICRNRGRKCSGARYERGCILSVGSGSYSRIFTGFGSG